MILLGIPYLVTTLTKNKFATSYAEHVYVVGINITKREYLSTTVKIASCPFFVIGKGPIKSILTIVNGVSGFSKGYNNPDGLLVSTLVR